MTIVLLIGAAEYPLSDLQAARLEGEIRKRCVNERRRAHDEDARACLQLADVLAEDLEAGFSPEPIELAFSHVEGLREYVVEADDARHEFPNLCEAVCRYCGR